MATGFFSAASLMIAIPSGIQMFAWVATIWNGRPVFTVPILFVIGFIVTFVIGGLTGVMFAAVPFDWQVTDTYFVVAHFHYVLIGGDVFPIFAALYYWLPKMTGRMLNERLGKLSFWLMFVGFQVTFFPMHIMGLLGMPRRIYTYQSGLGWDVWNLISSIGSFVLAAGVLAFIIDYYLESPAWTARRRRPVGRRHPRVGDLSPPPAYNFESIPQVASREPLWDQPDLPQADPPWYARDPSCSGATRPWARVCSMPTAKRCWRCPANHRGL